MTASGSTRTFPILKQSTAFTICTPGDFILPVHRKNSGRTGSRYIYINRYMDAPKPVYATLFQLVKDKDYFVITTNLRSDDKFV